MPYKVGKLYCTIAKDDGVVINKTDKILIVEYKDKSKDSVDLGTIYGRMEGSVYPHNVVSDYEKNSKFKKGDFLAYNTGFFERDWVDSSKLIMKFNKLINVALSLTPDVFEDSSAISSNLSEQMTTETVKEKSFTIDFNKNIINIIPVGTKVSPEDILFTIVDEQTDYSNLSDTAIQMLQTLAQVSPKAKVNGVIDRYEVRYNGEIQDMSPTLSKLARKADKDIETTTEGTSRPIKNCRVSNEYTIEGKNLQMDQLELRVYIKVNVTQAVGDKGVFAHQMKSVISDVYTNTVTTESGEIIDARFSYESIMARIVNSPVLIGTTNRLVKHVSALVADVYFGTK